MLNNKLQRGEVVLEVTSGSQDKTHEGRGGLEGTGQVLRVVLDTDEVRVVSHLDNLHALTGLVLADKLKTLGVESVDHLGVDLITMTMTLQNAVSTSIQLAKLGVLSSLLEQCRLYSEPHRSTQVSLADLRHEDNDG